MTMYQFMVNAFYMPARPWFTAANEKAADEATAEMRRVWEEKQNER